MVCLSNSSFSNGGKVGKGACDNPTDFAGGFAFNQVPQGTFGEWYEKP